MLIRLIVASALAGVGFLLPTPWSEVSMTLAVALVIGGVITKFFPNLKPKPTNRFGPPIAFEPGVHRVVLTAPERDLKVVAELRASLDLPLAEAVDLVREKPATVVRDVAQHDAEELARRLRAAGATVTVAPF
jgi:hypothetical protein